MVKKGQSAIAYLIMIAAVLTIAVTGIVIAQSILTPAEAANMVVEDKYKASMIGMELVEYSKPYNGGELYAPSAVIYNSEPLTVSLSDLHPSRHDHRLTEIGHNEYLGKFDIYYEEDHIEIQSFSSKVCEWGVIELNIPEHLIDAFCLEILTQGLDTSSDLNAIIGATNQANSAINPNGAAN